ncbi:hypothetical protein EXN66_Car007606 [Channa argus]|uniref:Uncharacterized protein n=1 Tax=Channa argus TaxID=215402 RepID=A0A6G1PNL5_CHAAH|nr:hypothetical protein EXN66_Car007606 [Channa argus]KAK2910234.1 hypothetical protein Q8A73_007949 [Channa argus]
MKLALVLVGLSVAVMGIMIFQAVRQELNLQNTKARLVENSADVKRKEDAIMEMKTKIQEMKTSLGSANAKIDELKKKKIDIVKSTEEFEKSLQTCNSEKEDSAKKKTSIGEAMSKFNADHLETKKKAEEEIQGLKQQIIDRDKAICAFADMAKEEARKLCGNSEAPK